MRPCKLILTLALPIFLCPPSTTLPLRKLAAETTLRSWPLGKVGALAPHLVAQMSGEIKASPLLAIFRFGTSIAHKSVKKTFPRETQ
jgi:hypothetical protein